MRLSALALLLIGHLAIVAGVVSPLDKVTQDMKAMKETLDSIQASLITSVSLLQGELSKRLMSLTDHVIHYTGAFLFYKLLRTCHADYGLAIMWRGRKGKLA